ncbi:MAG: TlpA disulfide reductase family protein [Bacteroidales bacterium]|nr:TlpA disulfide reductase family protein [Bacteroidales bacterium]
MNKAIPRMMGLIMVLTGFSCSGGRTEISGLIRGGEEISLTLERLDVNRTSVVDSLKTDKDGSFSIKLALEEPELYLLKDEKGAIINLLLAPGDRISVQSSLDSFGSNYQVAGSEESEGIRKLVEHLDQTRKTLDSLHLEAGSIGDPENPRFELVKNAYAQAIIRQKRFTIKYLVEHMGSLSSVYALYQKYDEESLILNLENDLQYFKAVADSLEVTYPNSSLTKSLRVDIEQREAAFNEAAKVNSLLEMADEESGLLDLSIPDREGHEITLSSLQGKVTLVAFWASGNNASIEALIRLQSTYNKYRDKGFEVYAISLDNNKINWMNAIDFNEFTWINVSELNFPESNAALLYNIRELPTTFLINREGDIVARNLYGRTLETWLDNLI